MSDFDENNEELDEEFFYEGSPLNALLEVIEAEQQKNKVYIVNPLRLAEMKKAFYDIRRIVLPVSPDAIIECKIDEVYRVHGHIRIETDEIEVQDTKEFINAIRTSDGLEIYPTTNDKLRMALTYSNVLIERELEE